MLLFCCATAVSELANTTDTVVTQQFTVDTVEGPSE